MGAIYLWVFGYGRLEIVVSKSDRSYVFGKPANVVTTILNLFIVFFYLYLCVARGKRARRGEVINYVSLQLLKTVEFSVFYGPATARLPTKTGFRFRFCPPNRT